MQLPELPTPLKPFVSKKDYGLATLTAGEAAALSAMISAGFQRETDKRHVAALADVIENSEWVGWPLLTVVVTKGYDPTRPSSTATTDSRRTSKQAGGRNAQSPSSTSSRWYAT